MYYGLNIFCHLCFRSSTPCSFPPGRAADCLPQGGTLPPARPFSPAPRAKRFLSLSISAISATLIGTIVFGIVVFWSLLVRSWRVLSPLDRPLGSLWLLLGPPGALLAASCLPFPLPPALDHSARRMLQTSFSTPYRTSTLLNLTPLNSTQLTSLFDLLGLHFGASWPPQIDPRSAQDRSKSHLEALFFQKRDF